MHRQSAVERGQHYAGMLMLIGWSLWTAPLTAAPADATNDIASLKRMSKAFAAVAKQAMPAVVFIRVEKTIQAQGPLYYDDPWGGGESPFDFLFRPPGRRGRLFRQMGQGTGFLISKDGYILTNNHVVDDADTITVKLHDGREFQAERIGSDAKTEVAVIKIKGHDFPFLPLGDSDALEIGEWVIAIGNPFGLSETLTVGVVSAKGRNNVGIADYEDFIQTDAAINPGNSGGPLLNIEGQAVGMNTAIFSQSGGSMGIGFAIPMAMCMAIKDQLVKAGKVSRGFMGVSIQDLTPDLRDSLKLAQSGGVLVAEVVKGGAADQAGLKAGDVVVGMEGRKIENAAAFRNQVAMSAPGAAVTLEIVRDGKPQTVKARIGSQTEPTEEAALQVEFLGIEVANVSERLGQRLGYEPDSGVVITAVQAGGVAARRGLRPGMLIYGVNRLAVSNVKEFAAALEEASAGRRMVVLYLRDGLTSEAVALPVK